MNQNLSKLHPYPFEKLRELHGNLEPETSLPAISMSIGEPKHAPPAIVTQALIDNIGSIQRYPTTLGLAELRQSICNWLERRFDLNQALDINSNVLPVNGTREALFSFAQALINNANSNIPDTVPHVVLPNPFYQIYEGAAILAGAKPYYVACDETSDYELNLASVPSDVWQKCQLIYICSPGNPTGAVMSLTQLQKLIELADEFDFVIASDECYSEIYRDESNPPPGLLQACASIGRNSYERCIVFHSLSKRSNLPGLRSGFVAGDSTLIASFLKYRTYHGSAMPVHTQIASAVAWDDETHVIENRKQYNKKFTAVTNILKDILSFKQPDAGFYLWPKININNSITSDTVFAKQLYQKTNVIVLPGQFLSRPFNGSNPGENHIRMALVATVSECEEAAQRIRSFLLTFQ